MLYYFMWIGGVALGGLFSMLAGGPNETSEIVMLSGFAFALPLIVITYLVTKN